QRGAGSRERDDLVLLSGLGRNQLDDCRVDVEAAERDRGNAVLLAEQRGDFVVLDVSELDQIEAELPPVLALIVQCLLELLGRNALLFEKQFSDSDRHHRPSANRRLAYRDEPFTVSSLYIRTGWGLISP